MSDGIVETPEGRMLNAGSSGEWGWHAVELAMKCPQAFAYNYRVKWGASDGERSGAGEAHPVRPSGGDRVALIKGSLLHQALAHYYARMRDGADAWASPEAAIDWCAAKMVQDGSRPEAVTPHIGLIKAAMRAYEAVYANDRLTPLHVEEVFSAEVNGRRFTQRLDFVLRNAAGKVVIWDHKSTAVMNSLTAQRYALSGQFLGMATFGREVFGKEFGGVWINLIEMNERGGVMGFDFRRVPVDPAPNALRLFPLTVRHARERIEALDAAGVDPWEWPKVLSETVCVSSYGKCEWFDVCRWGKT